MLEALFLAVGFITNREGPDLLEPITRNLILRFLELRHKSIRSLIYKYAGSARVSLNLDPIGKIGIELDSEWHIKKLHRSQFENKKHSNFSKDTLLSA